MSLSIDVPLKSRNSFSVNAITPALYSADSIDALIEIAHKLEQPFYILGEGSNTLFVEGAAPVIIQAAFKGVEIIKTQDHYQLKVAAAESWHDLVCRCVEQGIAGLENLALIPGSVGAAPVQNIGAYGVEFSDICQSVSWFCFETKKLKKIKKLECGFEYRNSIFKAELKGKGIITSVTLILPKISKPKLQYAGLDILSSNATPKEIMAKVIEIRRSKLPDPKFLPNAGSFFKNPVVSLDLYHELLAVYPKMPSYPQGKNKVKLAAGWLIEQAGLKGFRLGCVGVHEMQALVIVNYGSEKGEDIRNLALHVQKVVFHKFSIKLEPEVRMIGKSGEVSL